MKICEYAVLLLRHAVHGIGVSVFLKIRAAIHCNTEARAPHHHMFKRTTRVSVHALTV